MERIEKIPVAHERRENVLERLYKRPWFTTVYTTITFLAACAVVLFQWEINGAILFAYIASFALISSPRLTDAMLPAMLLSVFVTKCYDSADIFLGKWPWMIPVVLSVVAHFIIYRNNYRRSFRIGPTFPALCAVSAAVTLGGLGTISPSDYFSGGSLFYTFGLGIGMVLFYLIVRANFNEDFTKDISRILYVTGLLACFCVIHFYYLDWETFWETKVFLIFQSQNNLSTFLMLAMPFPMLYASKRYVDLCAVLLMYFCIILTASRGGFLMGTVEFLLILTIFAMRRPTPVVLRILCGCLILAVIGFLCVFLPRWMDFMLISNGLTDTTPISYLIALKDNIFGDNEIRVRLIHRMAEDFRLNPLFGTGIGYTGNADLYSPVKGAMNWYHMWFAQVVGGLGIVGILAYGYQLCNRIAVFIKNRRLETLIMFLSYLGLFLMSQVNPGEFCPMPYAALAVTYFAVMEETPKIKKKSWWQNQKTQKRVKSIP